jgi:flagellar protein FliS
MAFTSRNPYQKYRQAEVESMSQGKLILMLYDGAIRFLDEALVKIEDFRNYDDVNQRLLRAQDILSELMVSLNMDAGEIANNLLSLYIYMKNQLIEANLQKDKAKIQEVVNYLKDLREAWKDVESEADKPKGPAGQQDSSGGISFTG